jgi:transposase
MSANFIACDRDQAFLLPPSLLEWVPEDHLVWTILGAVEEMDLSAFYEGYRADGHGRPAYDPKMMLALLLYAYAQGNRSSRRIERACREDVAYMVITAMRVPDHSTIAEFRRRHESALGEVFNETLRLCRAAGMAKVGVVVGDGTKVHANASHHRNVGYERLVRSILNEADRIDREEDEQHGRARGDEVPEQLRTVEGRRAALREAKSRLQREREQQELESEEPASEQEQEPMLSVELQFDEQEIVARGKGREGWLHEARQQVNEHRQAQRQPMPRARGERLLEAERRMHENLAAERAANEAYEHYRAHGRMKNGRRFGGPPKPYEPPPEPTGMINTTDLDARNMQTINGWVTGYNAQAAVSEDYVVLAAEITVESPDFGHLEQIVQAAEAELAKAGIPEKIETLIADAGYWHQQQMEKIIARGTQVLLPPDADGYQRTEPRPGWDKGLAAFMRRVLQTDLGRSLYKRRQAIVEPTFGDLKSNRGFTRFQRRGRAAVHSEWRLANGSHNLLRLYRHRTATAGA